MRDMTNGEKHSWYERHQWPCGHKHKSYLMGPSGGMMRNIGCPEPGCALQLNVIDPELGRQTAWGTLPAFGQVLVEPTGYVPPSLPWRTRVWNTIKLGTRNLSKKLRRRS